MDPPPRSTESPVEGTLEPIAGQRTPADLTKDRVIEDHRVTYVWRVLFAGRTASLCEVGIGPLRTSVGDRRGLRPKARVSDEEDGRASTKTDSG